jgi:DNA-binding XRE family transcriptional regulator
MVNKANGVTLVELRKKAGVTQKELAETVGVSETSVRNWEHGREEPRLFLWQVKALCNRLQCGLEDLPDRFKQQNA